MAQGSMSDDRPQSTSIGDVHFAFGPDQSCFLACRNIWFYYGPERVSKQMKLDSFRATYIAALAPDNIYFVAGRADSGIVRMRWAFPAGEDGEMQVWKKGRGEKEARDNKEAEGKESWELQSKSRDAYAALRRWIEENFVLEHDALCQSTVTFGPHRSFYARTPKGCLWNNLPSGLEKHITEDMPTRGPPRAVTLGVAGTWVAFWDDRIAWELENHYDDVHEVLSADTETTGGIKAVALSPTTDHYFVHCGNGALYWSIDLHGDALKTFKQKCYAYMQTKAREEKKTFNMQSFKSGQRKARTAITISPTTKFDAWEDGGTGRMSAAQDWMRERWAWQGDLRTSFRTGPGIIGILAVVSALPLFRKPLVRGFQGLRRRWWSPASRKASSKVDKDL